MSNQQNLKKHFKDLINQNVSVVASNPQEMDQANKQLFAFLEAKLELLSEEHAELKDLLAATEAAGMAPAKVKSRLRLVEKRINYYGKIKGAVYAGYHIVPDFPVEIFAVRTNANLPRYKQSHYQHSRDLQANAQLLPSGEGRYVSPTTDLDWKEHERENGSKYTTYWPINFREVDFPITLVKPQVIRETGRALEQKIFDELGICRQSSGDPMIIGRLKQPGSYKVTCFLITWFLEAKDL